MLAPARYACSCSRSARVSGCASSHPGGNATDSDLALRQRRDSRQEVVRARAVQHHREAEQHAEPARAASLPGYELLEHRRRELPPMPAHQRRQHRLCLAREPGHVAVGEEVSAVLVVLVVGDEESRLVQARRPAQHLLRVLAFDPPGRRHLTVQRERGHRDPLALLGVDAIPLDPALDRGVADVLVAGCGRRGRTAALRATPCRKRRDARWRAHRGRRRAPQPRPGARDAGRP